jgi:hypothetical protein
MSDIIIGRPQKGQKTPGSGRQKGVTNGDTAKLRALILGALDDVGGQEYLATQAVEQPVAFLGLIGKVLPKEVAQQIDLTSSLKSITIINAEDLVNK